MQVWPGNLGGMYLLKQGFRMTQKHCQALSGLQIVTLLLFHMAINAFAREVLEDIKSD